MDTERVLIVGGGIAGLSLDLALRGGPWQVELVEREAGQARLGAGLAVQPNAMRALRGLGAAAAVERAARSSTGSSTGTSTARCCATSTSTICGGRWARSSASPGRHCTTRCCQTRAGAAPGGRRPLSGSTAGGYR